MGPYPHEEPVAQITDDNPAGTVGFEFIEFAHPEPAKLAALFEQMGFGEVARHKTKEVSLYRQGDVNYLINAEKDSFAAKFAQAHGPCACAMAWRVADAEKALAHAVANGAKAIYAPANAGRDAATRY